MDSMIGQQYPNRRRRTTLRDRAQAAYGCLHFVASVLRARLAPFDLLMRKLLWFVSLSAAFYYLWTFTHRLGREDTLLIHVTGFVAVAVGLCYSVLVDDDILRIACQLQADNTIQLNESRFHQISRRFRENSIMLQVILAIAVIVGVHFVEPTSGLHKLLSMDRSSVNWDYVGAFLFFPGLVGVRIGRIVANVINGYLITRRDYTTWLVVANHPDKSGGVARFGNFYLKQSSVFLVPAIWMFIWIMLISYDDFVGSNTLSECYGVMDAMWVMMVVCVLLSTLVFVVPMWRVSGSILSWKRENERDMDRLRTGLKALTERPRWYMNSISRLRVKELVEYLDSYVSMSDWGIHPSVRMAIFAAFATLVTSTILALVIALFLSDTTSAMDFDRYACRERK